MSPSDLSYYAPSPVQLVLALVCVIVVQKLKLTDRFPWLTEYTDSANQVASVLLAVFATAVFHWRDMIHWSQADGITLAKDAGIQWVCQQGIYSVGVKDSLKTLFRMLGLGPAPITASTETHATTVVDGTTVKRDVVEKVQVTPPIQKP